MIASSGSAPLYAPITPTHRPRPAVGQRWELPSRRIAEVRRVVGSQRPRVIARYVENGVLTAKEIDLPMTVFVQHSRAVA
jgi:hypothetical protein